MVLIGTLITYISIEAFVKADSYIRINSDAIFQEAIETIKVGIKVNGQSINNIRCADDTTILADKMEDLQALVQPVNDKGYNFGLNFNIKKKNKFMIESRSKITYPTAIPSITNT